MAEYSEVCTLRWSLQSVHSKLRAVCTMKWALWRIHYNVCNLKCALYSTLQKVSSLMSPFIKTAWKQWLDLFSSVLSVLSDEGTLLPELMWWSWVEIWTCIRMILVPDCWGATRDWRTASQRPTALMLVLKSDVTGLSRDSMSCTNVLSLYQGCEGGNTHISENPFTNSDELVPFGGGVRIDYILFKVNVT